MRKHGILLHIAHKILAASFMAGSKKTETSFFCRNRYIQKSITGGQKMEDNNKLHYGLSLRPVF